MDPMDISSPPRPPVSSSSAPVNFQTDTISTKLISMLHAWETIALNPSYNHLLERKPTYDNTYNYVSGDLRSLADVTDGLVMAGGSLKRGDFAQFRTAKTPADGCCLRERREDEPGFLPPDRKRAAKNSKKLTPRQQYDDFMEQVAAGLQRREEALDKSAWGGSSSVSSKSVAEQALTALKEEAARLAIDRERIASLPAVNYKENRKRQQAEANLAAEERIMRMEREKIQKEMDLMTAMQAESTDGKSYGMIEQQTFFSAAVTVVDRTAEVAVLAATILEPFLAAEYDDGTGYMSNPFRVEITRANCVSMGIGDYFDMIQLAMSLPTIERKVKDAKYLDLKGFFADFIIMINNCFIYNPVGTAVRKAGEELAKDVKATNKKFKKNELFDHTKFLPPP